MDILVVLLLAEYIVSLVLGFMIAMLWRPRASYWPAGRVLSLAIGARGMYYLALEAIYRFSGGTSTLTESADLAVYHGVLTTLFIVLLIWVLVIVLRVNRAMDRGLRPEPKSYTGAIED